MVPTIPEPLARAFQDRVAIKAPELCRLLDMDPGTLRKHVEAGHIAYVKTGFGEVAPRRAFTLEAVQRFLSERSTVEACRSSSAPARRSTRTTSSAEGEGFLALWARETAARLKREAESRKR